jgi:hypothetical protein
MVIKVVKIVNTSSSLSSDIVLITTITLSPPPSLDPSPDPLPYDRSGRLDSLRG